MIALLLLLCMTVGSMAQLPDCSKPFILTDPTSKTAYSYNLAPAAVTDPSKLIAGLEGSNSWTLYVNICGNAAIQAGTTCPAPTPSCQVDGNNAFDCGGDGANNINYNVGPYYDPANPSQFFYDQGVVIVAGGGGGCDQNTVTRTTTLFLKCDPSQSTMTQVGAKQCTTPGCFDVSEASLCQYAFAPIAWSGFCPGGGGGGDNGFDFGWVFVIIVLCGLFLYFVLGIIILKFALHKEGREVVPQVEFWSALPGLVLDGIKFTWRKITCQSGGYTEV